MDRRRTVRLTIVFLLLGAVLRVWFVQYEPQVSGDATVYGEIARNWLQRGVYGFDDGDYVRPTLIRLPGYSLFLAACFKVFGVGSFQAVLYVQAGIDLLTCLLIGGVARRLAGERAGMWALGLAALCPFTANYAAAGLTETLSLFAIALAFYGLVRWRESESARWLVVIATALSYAILLRPDQGLLAAVVLPAMWWIGCLRGDAGVLRKVLVCALLAMAPFVPWTVRNWRVFHVVQPLAPRQANDPGEKIPVGFQRWYRTWAVDFASTEDVYWKYFGEPFEVSKLPVRAFDSPTQKAETERLVASYDVTAKYDVAIDAGFDRLGRERIAANPSRYYVLLPAARLLNMWFRPRVEMLPVQVEWWKWSEGRGKTVFAAVYGLLNFALVLGAGIGLWKTQWEGDGRVVVIAMAAFVMLRCALLLTLDNSEPRYTLECFPMLFVWAGALCAKTRDA